MVFPYGCAIPGRFVCCIDTRQTTKNHKRTPINTTKRNSSRFWWTSWLSPTAWAYSLVSLVIPSAVMYYVDLVGLAIGYSLLQISNCMLCAHLIMTGMTLWTRVPNCNNVGSVARLVMFPPSGLYSFFFGFMRQNGGEMGLRRGRALHRLPARRNPCVAAAALPSTIYPTSPPPPRLFLGFALRFLYLYVFLSHFCQILAMALLYRWSCATGRASSMVGYDRGLPLLLLLLHLRVPRPTLDPGVHGGVSPVAPKSYRIGSI